MPCTFISYKKPPSTGSGPLPTLQIGSGTDSLRKLPLYGLYDYSQGGMIYLAEELIAAAKTDVSGGGSITNISFELTGWLSGYKIQNQIIKMHHVAEREHARAGHPDYRELTIADTTTVVSFPEIVMSSGWKKFDFTTPFNWDGTSNILITWENRDGSWASGYGHLKGSDAFLNRSTAWYEDDSYPTRPRYHEAGRANLIINAPAEPPR